MIYPYLLISFSLILASIEDARTKRVHNYLWIPFTIGAVWILLFEPKTLELFGLITLVSLTGVYFKLLGGADIFAFGAIALLGFSWHLVFAGLAFAFLLIPWASYLLLRGTLFHTRVPAIPIVCLTFLVAIIL